MKIHPRQQRKSRITIYTNGLPLDSIDKLSVKHVLHLCRLFDNKSKKLKTKKEGLKYLKSIDFRLHSTEKMDSFRKLKSVYLQEKIKQNSLRRDRRRQDKTQKNFWFDFLSQLPTNQSLSFLVKSVTNRFEYDPIKILNSVSSYFRVHVVDIFQEKKNGFITLLVTQTKQSNPIKIQFGYLDRMCENHIRIIAQQQGTYSSNFFCVNKFLLFLNVFLPDLTCIDAISMLFFEYLL